MTRRHSGASSNHGAVDGGSRPAMNNNELVFKALLKYYEQKGDYEKVHRLKHNPLQQRPEDEKVRQTPQFRTSVQVKSREPSTNTFASSKEQRTSKGARPQITPPSPCLTTFASGRDPMTSPDIPPDMLSRSEVPAKIRPRLFVPDECSVSFEETSENSSDLQTTFASTSSGIMPVVPPLPCESFDHHVTIQEIVDQFFGNRCGMDELGKSQYPVGIAPLSINPMPQYNKVEVVDSKQKPNGSKERVNKSGSKEKLKNAKSLPDTSKPNDQLPPPVPMPKLSPTYNSEQGTFASSGHSSTDGDEQRKQFVSSAGQTDSLVKLLKEISVEKFVDFFMEARKGQDQVCLGSGSNEPSSQTVPLRPTVTSSDTSRPAEPLKPLKEHKHRKEPRDDDGDLDKMVDRKTKASEKLDGRNNNSDKLKEKEELQQKRKYPVDCPTCTFSPGVGSDEFVPSPDSPHSNERPKVWVSRSLDNTENKTQTNTNTNATTNKNNTPAANSIHVGRVRLREISVGPRPKTVRQKPVNATSAELKEDEVVTKADKQVQCSNVDDEKESDVNWEPQTYSEERKEELKGSDTPTNIKTPQESPKPDDSQQQQPPPPQQQQQQPLIPADLTDLSLTTKQLDKMTNREASKIKLKILAAIDRALKKEMDKVQRDQADKPIDKTAVKPENRQKRREHLVEYPGITDLLSPESKQARKGGEVDEIPVKGRERDCVWPAPNSWSGSEEQAENEEVWQVKRKQKKAKRAKKEAAREQVKKEVMKKINEVKNAVADEMLLSRKNSVEFKEKDTREKKADFMIIPQLTVKRHGKDAVVEVKTDVIDQQNHLRQHRLVCQLPNLEPGSVKVDGVEFKKLV